MKKQRMKVEIVDLTEENLSNAPEWKSHPYSCKYCIYWEYPEECIQPFKEKKEDMIEMKLKWLRNTRENFGNCGKIIYVDEKAIGFTQYATLEFLPRSSHFQTVPPGNDAVLISCLFIAKREYRRLGLGSQLLQSIIDELRERGVNAIETFARKESSENPSGPVEFYLKNGFRIFRDNPEVPIMRLDL